MAEEYLKSKDDPELLQNFVNSWPVSYTHLSEIRIRDTSKELYDWAQENLIIPNPQYRERERRGLWVGNTPKYLWLYHVDGSDLIVPTGVGKQVRQFLSDKDQIRIHLADNGLLDYKGTIPLYDYQKEADVYKRQLLCSWSRSGCCRLCCIYGERPEPERQ